MKKMLAPPALTLVLILAAFGVASMIERSRPRGIPEDPRSSPIRIVLDWPAFPEVELDVVALVDPADELDACHATVADWEVRHHMHRRAIDLWKDLALECQEHREDDLDIVHGREPAYAPNPEGGE